MGGSLAFGLGRETKYSAAQKTSLLRSQSATNYLAPNREMEILIVSGMQ
jgi:hypothetical protein